MSKKIILSLVMVLAAVLSVGIAFAAVTATINFDPDNTIDTSDYEVNITVDYSGTPLPVADSKIEIGTYLSDTKSNVSSHTVSWDGYDSGSLLGNGDYTVNISWDADGDATFEGGDTATVTIAVPDKALHISGLERQEVELTDEEQPGFSEDFTIKNVGRELSNFNFNTELILEWEGEGLDESGNVSVTIDNPSNTFDRWDERTVTVHIPGIPEAGDVEAYGVYSGDIVFKEGDEEITRTAFELELQPENYQTDEGKLNIREIDIGDDRLFPGEETEVEVEIENEYSNKDIENIEVTILIPALDIEEEAELDELRDGDDDTVSLNIEIPTDADEDDYTLIILAAGENEDGDELSDYDISKEIEVERDSHDIIVEEIDIDDDSPSCGDTIEVKVSVTNIGKKDEEEVSIVLKNTELDIEATKSVGDLDEGDDATETFEIDIPRVVSGTYLLDASVTYEDVDDQDNDEHLTLSKEIEITCKGVSPVETGAAGIISGATTKAISPGETGSYALVITNTGEIPVVYSLDISGYSDWAEASVEPEEFLLAAGQEVPFYIYLTPDSDASGSGTATLSVYEGETLIDSITLTADITEAEEGFRVKPLEPGVSAGWFNLTQNDLIAISMVVLAVIVLAAIYAFGVRIPKKGGRKL